MPTSMRPWRATFAAAGPMCASGRPSRTRRRSHVVSHKQHCADSSDTVVPEQLSAPSRRHFVKLAVGTAFVLGFYLPVRRNSEAGEPASYAPNAFIRIDQQGEITLVMPQAEMGQGVYTSLSMVLAEELDADWSHVRLEAAPPDIKRYANPMLGDQA